MTKKTAILFLILWGLIGATKLRAQDSVQQALSYYPLRTGNEWQYRYRYLYITDLDSGYVNVKVTGDTLMSDNHHRYQIVQWHYYRQIDRQGDLKLERKTGYYERIDSATANVYRIGSSGEFLLDSLMIQKGDTIFTIPHVVFTTCYDTARWLIFGAVHPIKRLFWFKGGIAGRDYDLARGIGIIYNYYRDEGTLGNTDTLIYAKINGVEYGTRVETPPLPIEQEPQPSRPHHFLLHQNYPNPFNPTTTIRYKLAHPALVRLTVYNILGQQVSVLVNGREPAGTHQVTFDASPLRGASGVYFYRLKAGDKMLMKKMLLMK